ncbi:MAG TPA: zf-HC2 domain-containing protein [Myxococcota bacterium]
MFLTCAQLAANLSALEDGEVSAVRRAEAAVHLSWCRDCQAYVAQFRAVRAALATASPTTTDTATTDTATALTAFRDWQPGVANDDDDHSDDSDDSDLP